MSRPQKGLRTLVVACRHFSPEEYEDVDRRLRAARTALQQREEKLQETFGYIERDLQLLGATGVEDKYGPQLLLFLFLVPSMKRLSKSIEEAKTSSQGLTLTLLLCSFLRYSNAVPGSI